MHNLTAGRDVTFTVSEMTALASALDTMLDAYKTVNDVLQAAGRRSFVVELSTDELSARRALKAGAL